MTSAPEQDSQRKPLKILTIDGGGLQAVSTLLILNQLLESIAIQNGVPDRKPRPCDVFDTIAGIGAGGWLAILLGRFRMDVASCLHEWYKITGRITPKSKTEQLRMRLFQQSYFDPGRLVEQIDRLTKLYGTGDYFFEDEPQGARTRHVFVAALNPDAQRYNLFRSYGIPASAALPAKLLEGPEHPETFKISHAFGVTGAARYFAPKWEERMAVNGKTRFRDTKFPEPHNITELALNEMWGIYGTKVPLSVVVNIGPGQPSDNDVKLIARRFSWGLNKNRSSNLRKERDPATSFPTPGAGKAILPPRPVGNIEPGTQRQSVHFSEDTIKEDPDTDTNVGSDCPAPPPRRTTFGSIRDRGIDAKLRRLESQIEKDIRTKLETFHPGNELYYRLAPDKAPEGTAQDDSSESSMAFDTTVAFLSGDHIKSTINRVAYRISIDEVTRAIPVTRL